MLPSFRLFIATVLTATLLAAAFIAALSIRTPPAVSSADGAGARFVSPSEWDLRLAREFARQATGRRAEELQRLLSIQIGPASAEAGVLTVPRLIDAAPPVTRLVALAPAERAAALRPSDPPMREVARVAPALLQAALPPPVAEAPPPTASLRGTPAIQLASLPAPQALRAADPAAGIRAIVAWDVPEVAGAAAGMSFGAPAPPSATVVVASLDVAASDAASEAPSADLSLGPPSTETSRELAPPEATSSIRLPQAAPMPRRRKAAVTANAREAAPGAQARTNSARPPLRRAAKPRRQPARRPATTQGRATASQDQGLWFGEPPARQPAAARSIYPFP